MHMSDVTIDLSKNQTKIHTTTSEPWKITLVDTGLETMTGSRLKKVEKYVGNQTFHLTYGDGLANVDITKLIKFHESHGKLATVTAVQPPGRYGALNRDNDLVTGFVEKPKGDGGWINGGFFVLSPKSIDYIDSDDTAWEQKPLKDIALKGELMAYEHKDFWQPMDTLREKYLLEELWESGKAPWKNW